jgi:hypothetical protein
VSKYNVSMGDPFDMLAEECGELIQELMKRRRFGDAGIASYAGTKPRENIIRELGDVLCLTRIIVESGYVTWVELGHASWTKRSRLRELFDDAP